MKMICDKAETCKIESCHEIKPHKQDKECSNTCMWGGKCIATEQPIEYADLTMTLQVNSKKFDEMKAQGMTDIQIQHTLEGEIQYYLARAPIALLQDTVEVKLRKWR
ncbi:hypothetical protein M0R04_08385 [Candidatus Dojkabacteria bacterium]|jgi:hypothetical protein|nr:hypothetical protein [Candidatus Dojkabacteria bacterium]